MANYRSAPTATDKMPGGIPYIVSNEAAERFSFYGMKGILIIFMTKYMLDSGGNPDLLAAAEARTWYHAFTSAVYFFPLIGAIIADAFLGKYKTILTLSVVYCLGHFALAMDETRLGLSIGLMLIAIGSGGIKPCVSAHVGDQFGKSNSHLLEKVFGWFYFSINLGAFASTLLTPWLLANYGPQLAFGVPGLLMLIATIFFWMGRNKFIHIPAGGSSFLRETFSKAGIGSIAKLFIIYAFVAMFWALFDQTGSAWVLQADKSDLMFLGHEWLPSQIQAVNPIMIMVFIPIFNYIVYPLLNKVFPLTPLRKIGIGFFVTVPAFLLPAWIETQIQAGDFPNIGWQLLAYAIITAAEVFVSITALEFSYTQAPKKMKSLVMAFFLLSVSLGNVFTGAVNFFIQTDAPAFEPDVRGSYLVQLAVSDGQETLTSQHSVEVLPADPNAEKAINPLFKPIVDLLTGKRIQGDPDAVKEVRPPTADAGKMFAVKPGEDVRVYGTGDKGDAKGDHAYRWTVKAQPDGADVTLDTPGARSPMFTPTIQGTYEVEFAYVVGNQEATAVVPVVVTTSNLAPIVSADVPAEVNLSLPGQDAAQVSLDAVATYDPNGDALTYEWSVIEAPSGSLVGRGSVENPDQAGASTKLDDVQYYLFFAMMMLITSILFIPVARAYKEKTYIQDEDDQVAA